MIRHLSILILAAGIAALVIAVGIAGVTRYSNPAAALTLMPRDAVALERRAEDLLQPNASGAQRREAKQLAMAAVERDATSVTALRVIGLIADDEGNYLLARQLFRHAARLSRRDFGVELWLIEHAVARDNARTALLHYDIALRTQRTAAAVLYPVLSQALSDARLIGPFAEMLARRPAWATAFLTHAAQDDTIDANFATLLGLLAQQATPIDPTVITVAVDRQVARGRFDVAWDLYSKTLGRGAPLIRDGGFDGVDRSIPFEWVFARAPERSSGLGTSALDYVAELGVGGDLAWQTTKLPPGKYILTAKIETASGRPPRWKLACLVPTLLPVPSTFVTNGIAFEVGSSCTYQRVTLAIDDIAQDERSAGTVDDVAIRDVH